MRYWILAGAVLLALAGCMPEEDVKTTEDSSEDSDSSTSDIDQFQNLLIDDWVSSCQNDFDDGSSETGIITFTTSVTTLNRRAWVSETVCPGVPDFSVDATSTYTVGDETSASLGSGTVEARRIDALLTGLTATAHNQFVADALSVAGFFGYTNWVVNVPKDILGLDSDGTPDPG